MRNLEAGTEADTTEKHCLLAYTQAHISVTFLYSLGLPAKR